MAEFKDINELFQYWENNTYPEYVCGIWSTNGSLFHLTVAVNDEKAEKEILELIENDSSVAFAYARYSKNFLVSIIDEMNSRFCEYEYANKTGFVLMSLDEYENRVDIAFKTEYENNEYCIELVNELESRFGEAINIEYTDAEFVLTDDLVLHDIPVNNEITYAPHKLNDGNILQGNMAACSIILALCVLILSTALVLRKNRGLQLTNGSVKNNSEARDNIESVIKESGLEPSADLDKRIMNMIDEI